MACPATHANTTPHHVTDNNTTGTTHTHTARESHLDQELRELDLVVPAEEGEVLGVHLVEGPVSPDGGVDHGLECLVCAQQQAVLVALVAGQLELCITQHNTTQQQPTTTTTTAKQHQHQHHKSRNTHGECGGAIVLSVTHRSDATLLPLALLLLILLVLRTLLLLLGLGVGLQTTTQKHNAAQHNTTKYNTAQQHNTTTQHITTQTAQHTTTNKTTTQTGQQNRNISDRNEGHTCDGWHTSSTFLTGAITYALTLGSCHITSHHITSTIIQCGSLLVRLFFFEYLMNQWVNFDETSCTG